jgi:hypothetical protein
MYLDVLDPVGLVYFWEQLRVGDGDHLVEPDHKIFMLTFL